MLSDFRDAIGILALDLDLAASETVADLAHRAGVLLTIDAAQGPYLRPAMRSLIQRSVDELRAADPRCSMGERSWLACDLRRAYSHLCNDEATDLQRFSALCLDPLRSSDHDAWRARWEAFCDEIGEDRYAAASNAYDMSFGHQQDRAYSAWEDEQR